MATNELAAHTHSMKTNKALAQHRLEAAEASGGKSSGPAYEIAMRLLQASNASGRLLEFGAGVGAFPRRLLAAGYGGQITCADILPKPLDAPPEFHWITADLNQPLDLRDESFDVIVSIEVIEHLENPRAVFREFARLLVPGGLLVVTTPHQHSIRGLSGLLLGGHFALFLGANYPAHITALLEKDLERICDESGFESPSFHFSGEGRIPKLTHWSWQQVSFGLLKGKLFSDNIGLLTRKRTVAAHR
jgi:2-polyprenyl-3-methyl-5-hydroxy-6-metoxy-1,4-benzoquinol methylase